MLVNHDVTNMMENIPDEKFKIIGIDKDAEAPSRPRIGYWRDAWRRLRENKVAFVALIILLILIFFIIFGPAISGYEFEQIDSDAIQARSTGLEQMIWAEIFLPEYGRRDVSLSSSVS